MILGIDPKVDYAFKHMLGRESTRPILIDVLNKVLAPGPGRHIQDIELLNPFNPKETIDDKLSILDVKARDQTGRQFNVEMQMLAFRYYEKRILYYCSRLHQHQLQEGQDYLELKPTISISFLDHVLFEHVPAEAMPVALQQPLVLRAVEELKMLTKTDEERERYEARRKAQLDYNTGLKAARLEGRTEGEIRTIHLYERLLQRPETPTEQLALLPLEELIRLTDNLLEQVLKQR